MRKCIEFVDPSMNDNAPFVVGLQNGNQCFYRKYEPSEYQDVHLDSRFMNQEKYACNRAEGGHSSNYKAQMYKVLKPDEKVAQMERDRIAAEKAEP